MVYPDVCIRLYISTFHCISTTIAIYSHFSETTICKPFFPV